ncbi:MAG: glycosyltransferase family 4 protein [Candidatus Saccharibacteria bacterium]
MKILMLGWELPPHNSGGLGVACYQLCKALASKGADIEFVLPYTAEHDISFMKVIPAQPKGVVEVQRAGNAYDSYKYIYHDGHSEQIDIFGQQQLYEHAVDEFVRETVTEFDVIHAHDWLTFRAAMRAKQQTNLPLIIHLHSIERDRAGGGAGNPLVREIEATAMLLADKIIAVSQHTKDMIVEDYDIPPSKVDVVYNSVDKEMIEPLDDQNAYRYLTALRKQGYRVVSNVGRLTMQKNLPNLLHAAKEVIARVPKTMFLIVGAGEQYFELISLAAELGIADHVILTGFQRGKRWRDSYAIADLFAMPSISEPFGLTALEAIGYGTPVLMSNQSGVAEVVRNSLKVNFWDVHEMANQIVAVMQNDSLRDELLANALQEYDELTWDDSAHKLFGIYDHHAQGAPA